MAFNPEKFINAAEATVKERLEGTQILSAVNNGIDDALTKVGAVFKTSKTKDTGGDTFVESMTEFERRQFGDADRTPDQPAKPVEQEAEKKQPEHLMYPSSLPEDFRFDLEFMDYKRPTPGSKATAERSLFLSLPLPRELYNNHSISYTTDELGLVGALADSLYVAGEMSDQDVTGQAAAAGRAGVAVGAGAVAARGMGGAAVRTMAGIVAAGLLDQGAQAAASQMTGAQLNPNLAVTFRGPTLRDFTFTWEFAPHSAAESQTLRKMLNEIQARSLPSMTFENSTGILAYPQMCQIKLEPETYKFKKTVVKGITINYAPGGAPSYFVGTKEPTLIAVTLQLTELEYFLSEDFGGDSAKGLNSDIYDIAEGIFDNFKEAVGEFFTDDKVAKETTDNE